VFAARAAATKGHERGTDLHSMSVMVLDEEWLHVVPGRLEQQQDMRPGAGATTVKPRAFPEVASSTASCCWPGKHHRGALHMHCGQGWQAHGESAAGLAARLLLAAVQARALLLLPAAARAAACCPWPALWTPGCLTRSRGGV
jgi:hypothetical protein